MDKLAFSAEEAGEIIGVSRWTIYRLIESGHLAKLPHLGKKVRIAGVEIQRFASLGVQHEATAS